MQNLKYDILINQIMRPRELLEITFIGIDFGLIITWTLASFILLLYCKPLQPNRKMSGL